MENTEQSRTENILEHNGVHFQQSLVLPPLSLAKENPAEMLQRQFLNIK